MILSHQDLHALFAKHCTCKPLDVTRDPADHSHDCVPELLADIQTVLRGNDGTVQSKRECYEAVKRCDRYSEGDYSPLKKVH